MHDCGMTKTKISTQKWRARGKGRGYGYVTFQKVHYMCSLNTNVQKSQLDISEKADDGRNVSANNSETILQGDQIMILDSAGILESEC